MKTVLFLEDTPQGVQVELRWQGNDCLDHLEDSIAMNVVGNLVRFIKTMEDSGAVRIVKEPST